VEYARPRGVLQHEGKVPRGEVEKEVKLEVCHDYVDKQRRVREKEGRQGIKGGIVSQYLKI